MTHDLRRPTDIPTEKMRDYIQILENENRELLLALKSDDDFVTVVRVHAYIDALLERLISLKFIPGGKVPRRMDFTSKYELAVALGLLEPDLIPTLQQLSELRNRFAHDPSAKLEGRHLEKLMATMTVEFKDIFDDVLSSNPITSDSPNRERDLLRFILKFVHDWIASDIEQADLEQ